MLCLLATVVACGAFAADKPAGDYAGFSHRHQVGLRLGVWSNMGSKPLKADTLDGSYYETDVKEGSFYFEGYFGYRLVPALMVELAAGIVNRGDVSINDNGQSIFGNLIVYPIQLRAKLYPLAGISNRFQPYVMGGGGIYHGRNSIQFTSSVDPFVTFVGESQTDLNFVLGGGVDCSVAHNIALDANVAYMPIHFSKDLISVRNYDALTVTVGIKYVLPFTTRR
ncbi:MAG: OmpW family outer membrane protein [Candidatus Zixiibacteriota bacterium]